MRRGKSIRSTRHRRLVVAAAVMIGLAGTRGVRADAAGDAEGPIDFARDIRPILSDACFVCHGPDAAARQANLRLDERDAVFAPRRRGAPVVPGDPDASLLYRRITAADADHRMPPPDVERRLTEREIALLRRWIDEGAEWAAHWAFVPPPETDPPAVADASWARNGIDRFILARLEREGLAPSRAAPRSALIRRVTLDLTGIPPTLEEVDAFLADDAPGAYERVVDRLLASPRYGERMAMAWLDLARYADTHGYHYDNERSMWRWRDWVIDAYNRNLPFDQFTTEQLAGDLLPGATLEQRIATGFNRNHPITWEGGVIPEEYRVEYVVDRVSTTSTVWMGLTMSCARCHDHKYDPITQREFYAFSAFFNGIPERGIDGQMGNAVPFVAAPDDDHAARLTTIETTIAALEARYATGRPGLDAAHDAWDAATAAAWNGAWRPLAPFAAHATGGTSLVLQDDGSLFAEGPHPDRQVYEVVALTDVSPVRAIRLEALADDRLPEGGPGRAFHANIVLSELEVEAAPLGVPGAPAVSVPLRAAHVDHAQSGFPAAGIIDGDVATGWALNGHRYGEDRVAIVVPAAPIANDGGTALRIRLRFESPYTQHALGRIRLSVTDDADLARRLAPSTLGPWHVSAPFPAEGARAAHETAFPPEAAIDLAADRTPDGSPRWTERTDLPDGAVHALEPHDNSATYLFRTIESPDERTVTLAFGSDDALRVWLNGAEIVTSGAPRGAGRDQDVVTAALRPGRNDLLVKVTNFGGACAFFFETRDDDGLDPPLLVLGQLQRTPADRTVATRDDLRDWYRRRHSPDDRAILDELAARRAERDRLARDVPTVMVMAEMEEPRPTYVLMRGRYDLRGDPVEAGVPAVLPPLPPGAAPDRLGLARWLTAPEHPLTARVAVNRYWTMHFGRGLVGTPEDFGAQAAPPSHPALLDWLARAFVASGWDVKAMHRLIVTSATYRQDAAVTPRLLAVDPDNRLLARGPRFRLSAETIRDAALAWSGLLVDRLGGPPVKPYQPEGLWKEVGSDFNAFSANVYERGTGDDLYRRSMYTFWKRTLPPPALQTFDAPTREYCVVTRSRTNTPLQALVLMNDPTFVEAARFLAARVLREVEGGDDRARVAHGFRIVTSRAPTAAEVDELVGLLAEQRAVFSGDAEAVRGLLGVGDGRHGDDLDRVELAAWTTIASVLLNLDEAITTG